MATAKQCDRCEKYYSNNHFKSDNLMSWKAQEEHEKFERISIITNKSRQKNYDLCDDCLKILDYFLSNKKIKLEGVI